MIDFEKPYLGRHFEPDRGSPNDMPVRPTKSDIRVSDLKLAWKRG